MKTNPSHYAAAVIFALIVAYLLISSPGHASAWPETRLARYQGARVTSSSAEVLTQMCVGETGPFDPYACVIQVGIIARRAARRGMRIETMARLYSSALRRPRHRAWILELRYQGRRPVGFPRRASWSRAAKGFDSLYRVVRSQLAGDVPDPCKVATHFGSLALDGHRARRGGWIRVCEDMGERQAAWVTRSDLAVMLR